MGGCRLCRPTGCPILSQTSKGQSLLGHRCCPTRAAGGPIKTPPFWSWGRVGKQTSVSAPACRHQAVNLFWSAYSLLLHPSGGDIQDDETFANRRTPCTPPLAYFALPIFWGNAHANRCSSRQVEVAYHTILDKFHIYSSCIMICMCMQSGIFFIF